jgi:predicted nucleic acid-binding protein
VAGARYRKPCLDSSVFIGGLEGEICNGIKRGVVFRYILEKARSGEFTIFISAITLAEVYKKKRRAKSTDPLLDEFLELVNEPIVEVIEVDRETGINAHKLCRRFAGNKLYPNDALHLACALRAGCDVLLAWDTPLIGIVHPNIRIEEPTIYDRTLFTESELATAEEIKAHDQARSAKTPVPSSPPLPGSPPGSPEGKAGAEAAEAKAEDEQAQSAAEGEGMTSTPKSETPASDKPAGDAKDSS